MNDSPRDPFRLRSYVGALGVFGTGVATAALVGRARGRSLQDRYAVLDVVLGGLAVQKFARLVAKDVVTTPLRAPFTEFEEMGGAGEVNERPRQGHPEHTVGEMLSCPFCLSPWVATGYVAALNISPPLARAWAAVFSMVGASDALQQGYARLRVD